MIYKEPRDIMFSLDEIAILPNQYPTKIASRSEVNPYKYDQLLPWANNKERLPIFVSPMTSVVCEENLEIFNEEGFIPIHPRIGEFIDRCDLAADFWTAFSLSEFEKILDDNIPSKYHMMFVLVDVANGHMQKLYDLAKRSKKEYRNIVLMLGNIADANMYRECCKCGVDYVRVGIGGGSACTTSVQTGIHVSLVSLIEKINEIKKEFDKPTKVIADGGINTIDKIVKCLALGYDYVMCGKLFAQTYEACGEIRTHIETADGKDIYADNNILSLARTVDGTKRLPVRFSGCFKKAYLERKYYGMASEQGQKDISGGVHKNPEGIETWVQIKWPVSTLKDMIESALRSSMSYTNSTNLAEFAESDFRIMTKSEFDSYNK